jgi:hypothetical protein
VPVAQKLASTGYRFARYYTGDAGYRAAGPPQILLRLLAPVLILLTVEVLGTGVLITVVDDGGLHRLLGELHKLGFFAWFAVTAVHVLTYVWRVPRLVVDDLPRRDGRTRAGVTLASVAVGCLLSLVVCNSLGVVTLW